MLKSKWGYFHGQFQGRKCISVYVKLFEIKLILCQYCSWPLTWTLLCVTGLGLCGITWANKTTISIVAAFSWAMLSAILTGSCAATPWTPATPTMRIWNINKSESWHLWMYLLLFYSITCFYIWLNYYSFCILFYLIFYFILDTSYCCIYVV